MLAGGPQGQLAAVPVRDRGVRLHRVLVDGGEGVLALDHHRGLGKGALDVAAAERVAVADVALPIGELPQAVRAARPRGLLVDQRGALGEGGLQRGRDRQLVVLDVDVRDRGVGGGLGLRRDHRDRLAGEPDLADGHDRTVAQRVAVVGIQVGQVLPGEDGDHAVELFRRRGVDGPDPGVCDRAVQDRAVEHAGQPDVAGEFGLAGQLEPAVGALHALPDDAFSAGPDDAFAGADHVHWLSPRISVSESRIDR